jgi:monofunctional biosynthetic peptidoglycan transglycosylase
MSINPKLKKILFWFIILQLALMAVLTASLFLSLPDVSGLKDGRPERTALMTLRLKQAEKKGSPLTIRQEWVPFAAIPKLMKDTVRIAEDANFYWHTGIDFEELKEAIKRNIREKRFARGASTITQQLAKNLYLSTEKSLLRKVKEYFITRRLEKALIKNRIFELYLNLIELGPGLFGVQAASKFYFGHSVDLLTLEEIVRLTAIIPRPLTTDPTGESGWLRWRCRWLLRKLLLYTYITESDYQRTTALFPEGP